MEIRTHSLRRPLPELRDVSPNLAKVFLDVLHQKMVDDINIKRRSLYAQKAQAANATLEEYAHTAGCLAIARTAPGEKYMTPQGSWETRASGAPIRDSRCP